MSLPDLNPLSLEESNEEEYDIYHDTKGRPRIAIALSIETGRPVIYSGYIICDSVNAAGVDRNQGFRLPLERLIELFRSLGVKAPVGLMRGRPLYVRI